MSGFCGLQCPFFIFLIALGSILMTFGASQTGLKFHHLSWLSWAPDPTHALARWYLGWVLVPIPTAKQFAGINNRDTMRHQTCMAETKKDEKYKNRVTRIMARGDHLQPGGPSTDGPKGMLLTYRYHFHILIFRKYNIKRDIQQFKNKKRRT